MVADGSNVPNFLNRTLWIEDNLKVLRGINSECIDLIYLDPPFNTKRIYNAPLGSQAAGAKFDDTWSMDSVKGEWAELQEAADPAMHHTVVGAGLSAGEAMQAYLSFMALRLIELHRILKESGSIYLHCDPHASHYLKQLMDCVFGQQSFRNEIVWSYRTGGVSKRYWPRKHDILLLYVKSDAYMHNPQRERIFYDKPFFTTEVDEEGRHFADVFVRDVWEDIKPLINTSQERTGWPTQKPLALLDRIIAASSNEGDWVLDPFAGCATTCIAAELAGRRWAGIDIDSTALDVTMNRLRREVDLRNNVTTRGESGTEQMPGFVRDETSGEWTVPEVTAADNPPIRTDPDRPTRSPRIRSIRWHELGTGERRPCPGCQKEKFLEDFDLNHIVPLAKGGLDGRRESATAVLLLQPHQGPAAYDGRTPSTEAGRNTTIAQGRDTMTTTNPRTPLPADYGDATPEQVAKAVLRFRPDAPVTGTKPWLRLGVKRDSDGLPVVDEITEHDERG